MVYEEVLDEDLGVVETVERPPTIIDKNPLETKRIRTSPVLKESKGARNKKKRSVQNSADSVEEGTTFDEVNLDKLKRKSGGTEEPQQYGNKRFKNKLNNKYVCQRVELPIYKAREQILFEINKNPVTIIVSETGSGKSTQIPQYLLEEGLLGKDEGGVVITQPRKVACLTLAERVSAEVGCNLGGKVGYSVRFDDRTSPATLIKFATDGMVLRELISDPLLRKYKYIILDEAHERTLRNDILIGHVRSIIKERAGECHVIIMSATLDSDRFSQFFNNAPVVKVSGRGHPVAIHTTKEVQSDYLDAAVQTILQIHLLTDPADEKDAPGKDILAFLPGQEEIEACAALLKRHLENPDLHHELANLQVFPLFAGLPAQQQSLALKPLTDKKVRKCILATNIAETSLTIPGIRYIVDTGVAKYRSYRPTTGMETLQVQPISKSGAAQRAGRAGREGPGICYRLYPLSEYLRLPNSDIPEIQRCNLDSALLTLMASGVNNVLQFGFLDRPPLATLERSLTNLFSLGALDPSNMSLAPLGRRMANFPLDPRFSKVVLSSQTYGCTQEILLILAALSVDNLFYSPQDRREEAAEARRRFVNPLSDHLTYLAVMREYAKEKVNPKEWCTTHFINHRSISQAQDIQNQLKNLCIQIELDPETSNSDEDTILKCLLQGCFLNTALLMPNGQYRTVESNQEVKIHPSSVMSGRKSEAVVYNELVETSHPYLRGVSAILRSWIADAAPQALAKRSMN